MPSETREDWIVREARKRPLAERSSFLDGACVGDDALRQRIEALLATQHTSSEATVKAESFEERQDEAEGQSFGRYKLLEKLGEGGFGAVWLAEQKEPVRRKVALKIIKLGMDTKAVVARFEAERQALAMMDHPNIAKVLDAGTTDVGRPYFVMELVRGIRITDYCDQAKLSTRERLELFIKVCQAIQHAHQKGIIHRDIKPSNILVTLHDGVPVPKVIDFGIAKATQGELTDKTIHTQFQQFIGTPAYMSPEQAEMSGLDIDTRSDIYSLGVLLYELLVGRTPFDGKELMSQGIDAMRKTIREKEPVRPSTKLGTLQGEELTTTATRRSADTARLLHQLKGDLDWIALKCLEKDRTRRYETANGLAMDIKRHLNNETVTARPPSKLYEFQKTFRRHKVGFLGTAGVVAALAVGVALATWQAVLATRAKQQAQTAQSREALQREQAEANAQKALEARASEAKLRLQAQEQELAARRRAYAADMNLAQQAISLNNFGRAQDMLNRHRPASSGEVDLRGWEWRYLWQMCQGDDLFMLCRRPNTVVSLASSQDGRWVAAGEYKPGGLSIWDSRTRQQIGGLPVEGTVQVGFCPQGSLLAISARVIRTNQPSGEYQVQVLDVKTRGVVATLPTGAECRAMAFSEDGSRLVTFVQDEFNINGNVMFWHLPDGQKLSSLAAPGLLENENRASFTSDLGLAAYAIENGQFSVLDLVTGNERWKAKGADNRVIALAFSKNGKVLASTAGYVEGAVRLWDVSSGQEIGRLEGHRAWVSALAFWPDGKTLATASADQTIRLWDISEPARGRQLAVLQGHNCEVWALCLLPDIVTLVSGGKDGSVRFWDTTNSRRKQPFTTVPEKALNWAFDSDGRSVVAVHQEGVARWTGDAFQQKQRIIKREDQSDANKKPTAGWMSPDGRVNAVGYTDGYIRVWDYERGALVREMPVSTQPIQSIDGVARAKRVIIQLSDNSLHEWDWIAGRETRSWLFPEQSRAGAVSPDERWHIRFGMQGRSVLCDLTTGTQRHLEVGLQQASDAAFSPDGKLLAVGSWLGMVKVLSVDTWREITTLRGFLLGVNSVAFSADGTRLAAGSAGKEAVKLWDTASFQELLTLEADGSSYHPTAFAPDGNVIGSANDGGDVHLWRAPSWKEISAAEATGKPDQRP